MWKRKKEKHSFDWRKLRKAEKSWIRCWKIAFHCNLCISPATIGCDHTVCTQTIVLKCNANIFHWARICRYFNVASAHKKSPVRFVECGTNDKFSVFCAQFYETIFCLGAQNSSWISMSARVLDAIWCGTVLVKNCMFSGQILWLKSIWMKRFISMKLSDNKYIRRIKVTLLSSLFFQAKCWWVKNIVI